MRIGKAYADNKLYRGIKHSRELPLLSENLHEFYDTLSEKNRYLLENVVGSGVLNNVQPYDTGTGIRLREPAVLNICGDICLAQTSSSTDLISNETLKSYSKGNIYIVGWYQNITSSTTMREYGGVFNDTLENDLFYVPLDIQVSSRYQLRWDIVVTDTPIEKGSSLVLPKRDSNGDLLEGNEEILIGDRSGYIYLATAPLSMDYVVDGLYIAPLLSYEYDGVDDQLTLLISYPSQHNMIESEIEPLGTYRSGTVWYNPINREFHTYVEGTGFVSNKSQMGFVQYQYVNTETTDSHMTTPEDLSYVIDEEVVPTILESDLIRVTYEGLELFLNIDYTLDTESRTITLLNFTRLKGEKLVLTLTRLVEANDVTSLSKALIEHMKTGAVDSEGHVKLSDTIESTESGLAVTPKAVRDSHVYTDEVTGNRYRIKISNGEIVLVPV